MSILLSGDIAETAEKLLNIMETRKMSPALFLFRGDLGTGKTTYIRNILDMAYGIKGVSSPTYTLIDSYTDKSVYHMDLYRIDDYEDMFETGIEEILQDGESRVFVEWPDRFMDYFSRFDYMLFDIIVDTETDERTIEVYENTIC